MMKRLLAILLALAMLLSVSAVFAETEEPAAEEPAAVEETAAAEEPVAEEPAAEEPAAVPDTLLVTINGQEIRENDEELQGYVTDMESQVGAPDEDTMRLIRMYAMMDVLQSRLIELKIAETYTEEELAEIKENAKTEWNGYIEEILATSYGITEESTEEERTAAVTEILSILESYYGYTEESYVAGAASQALAMKVTEELKASNPELTATEEEIEQYYSETVADEMEQVGNGGNDAATYEFYQNYYGYEFHYIPEGYRGITHILLSVDETLLNNWIDLSARLEESNDQTESTEETEAAETDETAEPTEEPVTEEMVEAARQAILDSQKEAIDDISARLAAGESFETLIAEYGTDPGMQQEDTLKNGYSIHKDSILYDSTFTNAAAALEKVGDVSDPVITQFGIHILYYLRDIPAGPIELSDDERETLRSEIEDERLNLAISDLLDQWMDEADIVWTEEGEAWKYDESFINALYGYAEEEPEEEPAEETAEEPAEQPVEETAEESAEQPAEETAE